MIYDHDARDLERLIRARSHAIWLAEGCPVGHAKEHWFRAKVELEAEFGVTVDELADNAIAPRLPISQPPRRQEAGRIGLSSTGRKDR